jgi:membrane-associated protein
VFLAYDVLGAVAWGVGLTVVGFHLGNVSFVGAHLELMVVLIAVLSTLPVAASVLRAALARRRAQRLSGRASPSPSRGPASTSRERRPDSGTRR